MACIGTEEEQNGNSNPTGENVKNKLVSACFSQESESGAAGIRTQNQRIMRPESQGNSDLQNKAFSETPEPACTNACTNLTVLSDTTSHGVAQRLTSMTTSEAVPLEPMTCLFPEREMMAMPALRVSLIDVIAGILALPLSNDEKADVIKKLTV